MPEPAIRIAARLDPESAETLEALKALTGERNLSRLVKQALRAYRRELERTPVEPDRTEPPPPPPKPRSEPPAVPSGEPRVAGFGPGERPCVVVLPFDPRQGRFDDEDLKRLSAGTRVRAYQPTFFQQDGRAYWTAWLHRDAEPAPDEGRANEPGPKPEDQALYQALREWRRDSAREAGVPVYVVATNRQLLAVAEARPRGLQALGRIPGFGKKKLARYGAAIVGLVAAASGP